MTHSHSFSRAFRQLHVIALTFSVLARDIRPRSNVEFDVRGTKLQFNTGKTTPLSEASNLIRI